jgi:hypothetical protein
LRNVLIPSFQPATAQFASPQSKNQKNDIIKRTIQGVIVALIYAHFAWATYYFVEKTGMIPPMVLSKFMPSYVTIIPRKNSCWISLLS